jgi:DNA modification methylase
MRYQIMTGDCRATLATLPDASVQCCVSSPPYWGLRDYGTPEQIGLESTPDAYVAALVAVFRDVRRVLADDGVLWLNLGDSYATGGGAVGRAPGGGDQGERFIRAGMINTQPNRMKLEGFKPKDLIGIPWRVAFALQADGWYLRSDVIWAKPNPMPESVTDRPTKSHEYVFLLSKAERYYYDAEAIAEPGAEPERVRRNEPFGGATGASVRHGAQSVVNGTIATRNARTVWNIATQPYRDAHFAVMPEALAARCIMAGSRFGDTVLDPFAGAGTTGVAALSNGRSFIGCEANTAYVAMADTRLRNVAPLFTEATA